jgi:lysozyme
MKLNQKGYDLIKEFEGLKLKPYLCSAKVPTIGYGSTYYINLQRVSMTDPPITKEKANEIFVFFADKFAERIAKLLKKPVSQNQFNALVSLAYNIGYGAFSDSTLLKLVNINPKDAMISKEFLKWNKINKVTVQGLTNRRIKESALYFSAS